MINAIKSKFTGDSIKAKAFRGSTWLAIGNISEKLLAFISKITLAKLLIPDELGIIVLLLSMTGLFECITEVGVKQCVIQDPNGKREEFLNMAFWFQAIRVGIIYVVGFFIAPLICEFYFSGHDKIFELYDFGTLVAMLKLTFLSVLFNGLVSPKTHILERDFKFEKVVFYMQSSAIAGLILTIILAFLLKNAWAMVFGFALQSLLRTLFSYIVCPFMPKLKFHKESFNSLYVFSKGMFGTPILTYLAYNIDIIVGGKMFKPELIGLYGFAIAIARTPRELFSKIIRPTLLPAFAHKQNKKETIQNAINKLTKIIAYIGLPCITFAFIFKNEILTYIYNETFQEVSWAFAIFCINVFFIINSIIYANFFLAIGKPSLMRNYSVIRFLAIILLIVPAIKVMAISGLAMSLTIANLVSLLYCTRKTKEILTSNNYSRPNLSGIK